MLTTLLGLFALLVVNSVYLSSVTLLEWSSGRTLQNQFYLWNFLAHLALGFAIVLPTIAFGVFHWRNVRSRPNPRAIAAGIATFISAIVLLTTGMLLTRVELAGTTIGVREPAWRDLIYWLHVVAPVAAVWMFVVHRLSGRTIRWKIGVRWAIAAALVVAGAVSFHFAASGDTAARPKDGQQYFEPSLAKTATGAFIPASSMMTNEYCIECHADVTRSWAHSAHAVSSFNNPFYTASVRETRQRAHANEGSVRDARFCAGCHDPVPFFSGAFEDPKWDDPNYAVASDPLGRASITCTVCHGIVSIDSPRGNADYTIEASAHYPLAFSDSPLLQWASNQLIKAKPAFHKRTFLKDSVHRSSQFCASCHKVSLPKELNDYKWLRGQDHYGSFLASGRSGHGVLGWYYPETAAQNCSSCHMKEQPSNDFAARDRDGSGVRSVLSHAFPSANTALSTLVDQSTGAMVPDAGEEYSNESADAARQSIQAGHALFNRTTLRVDLFAVREGGTIDGALSIIGGEFPVLEAGKKYLLEVVVRTLDIGHEFTQGTADSNEAWLYARARCGEADLGTTGGMNARGALDPWSRMFNAFVIDRSGHRIDRRNPQDIFLSLYNNQIPPGAGDVTHLQVDVPLTAAAPIEIVTEVRYRKFDAAYVQYSLGEERVNDLPVLVLARDRVTLPLRAQDGTIYGARRGADDAIVAWQRWYDYGIGLLREGDRGAGRGALVQAQEAFQMVESLAPSVGALASARLAIREGRLEEAAAALTRATKAAADGAKPSFPWTIAYFTALVDKQNGNFTAALEGFRRVLATDFATARERGFDFSLDTRVLHELAETALEELALGRGDLADEAELAYEALRAVDASLAIDPEQAPTWWLRVRACTALNDQGGAEAARKQHALYKPDENARDTAVRLARERYPWANHAAEATVIYPLMREGRLEGDLLPNSALVVP